MDKSATRFSMDPGGRYIICNDCKHYNRNATCKAFPNGIPKTLIEKNEHTEPFDGDNDIMFEMRENR